MGGRGVQKAPSDVHLLVFITSFHDIYRSSFFYNLYQTPKFRNCVALGFLQRFGVCLFRKHVIYDVPCQHIDWRFGTAAKEILTSLLYILLFTPLDADINLALLVPKFPTVDR